MNRRALFGFDRTAFVDRITRHIEHATQRFRTNRHRDGATGVCDLLTADHAFGGVHGQGPNGVFTEVLRDLKDQAVALVLGFKGIQDRRKIAIELNVYDGAQNLGDFANGICGHQYSPFLAS